MSNLTNKSELLFLYDVKDASPNGDPLDENKPRMNEETGYNIVTDVRLKGPSGTICTHTKDTTGRMARIFLCRRLPPTTKAIYRLAKRRAMDFNGHREEILERCVDIRLFGGTIPLKDSITLTGRFQFRMSRSLHPVVMKHIKGTGAFASKEEQSSPRFVKKTFLLFTHCFPRHCESGGGGKQHGFPGGYQAASGRHVGGNAEPHLTLQVRTVAQTTAEAQLQFPWILHWRP